MPTTPATADPVTLPVVIDLGRRARMCPSFPSLPLRLGNATAEEGYVHRDESTGVLWGYAAGTCIPDLTDAATFGVLLLAAVEVRGDLMAKAVDAKRGELRAGRLVVLGPRAEDRVFLPDETTTPAEDRAREASSLLASALSRLATGGVPRPYVADGFLRVLEMGR